MELFDKLTALFRENPIERAMLVVMLCAIAGLFALLVRSYNAHLKTAVALAPIADKMTSTIEKNSEVIAQAVQQLHEQSSLRRAELRAQAKNRAQLQPPKEE